MRFLIHVIIDTENIRMTITVKFINDKGANEHSVHSLFWCFHLTSDTRKQTSPIIIAPANSAKSAPSNAPSLAITVAR